jgi:hypothetical protein
VSLAERGRVEGCTFRHAAKKSPTQPSPSSGVLGAARQRASRSMTQLVADSLGRDDGKGWLMWSVEVDDCLGIGNFPGLSHILDLRKVIEQQAQPAGQNLSIGQAEQRVNLKFAALFACFASRD